MTPVSPFYYKVGPNNTFVVCDRSHDIMDSIPTEVAASNIANKMNRAWQLGYAAAQVDIQKAMGIRP